VSPLTPHISFSPRMVHNLSDADPLVRRLAQARGLGVDVKVILTPPCIFCMENC
jgi:hypothetical protein